MRPYPVSAATLFLVVVSSAVADTPLQDENLLVALPTGWVLGNGARQGDLTMMEYVPAGQTVEDWKQMITVQILHGRGHVKPLAFLKEMTRAAKEQVVANGFSELSMDAPADPEYPTAGTIWLSEHVKSTGKGEITLIRVIQGKDALYVVQKAWRQSPFKTAEQMEVTTEEMREGIEFLWKARVVDTRK